jgi:5'-methylthioadenosine phosphorylase
MGKVRVGLIGGSGLGEVLGTQTSGTRHEVTTPFGPPSDAIVETSWAGVPVFVLPRHGPGHLKNPSQVPYRANIFAMKLLGVTHLIASGAVGSLRDEFKPRDLVIPDQAIDKTSNRPGSFYDNAAVHVEFAEPFCPVLRQLLLEAAGKMKRSEDGGLWMEDGKKDDVTSSPSSILHPPSSPSSHTTHPRGCYVCMEGPAFSTRAESLMHRLWGGDLIGMTAMPEAKLAREAEISYALVALVTDYDCWKTKPPTESHDPFALLNEIIGHLKAASANAIGLMKRTVELIASKTDALPESPAHHALRLGIWSDKAKISPDEVERLRPLWGTYFQSPGT